jgi:pantothenate kinase
MTQSPIPIPAEYLVRLKTLVSSGQRKILGLVGSPGSGKSTLATALQQHFPDIIQIVPMDGFHLSNSELKRIGLAHKKGAQETFDSSGYVALLERMRNNYGKKVVYAPEFVRELEEPIANSIAILPTTSLVITEGNYLLLRDGPWAEVRSYLDESWYIGIDSKLRTDRLVKRHEFFGKSHQNALDWVEQTDEPNARLIESTKGSADLIFNWG